MSEHHCDECGLNIESGVACDQYLNVNCPFRTLFEEEMGNAKPAHSTYGDLLESMPSDEDFEGHEAAIPSID